MEYYIPETVIEEIRVRADIVKIILDHVVIKKSGQNYKGLCPFHPEKTPSFVVSPAKQIYHCFGCSAGGNVFKFLMETEGITFIEAVKKLAARCHVVLPDAPGKRRNPAVAGEREALFRLHTEAADYFVSLLRHPAKGKEAREYLRARAFDDATIEKYQLGWAPPGWRELLTHFEQAGKTSRAQLEKAGLVKRGNTNQDAFYDRFRGRIIFPLKDAQGRIIGFAGRVLAENDKEPKYLNSPETSLYVKGHHLFGLDRAKADIRRANRALIVEGYFDQLRAAQAGIHHVVATSGTALTPRQAALLKNHTLNVVLVFDADAAGQSAAERGFDLLLDQGMDVGIVALPEGHDPDSFLREHGAPAFLRLVDNAEPYVEYFIRKAADDGDTGKPSGRIEIANRVLPLLCKIKNSVARAEALRLLSEQLGTDDRALLAELKKAVKKEKPFIRQPESKPTKLDTPEEHYLIHLLLSGGETAEAIRRQIPLEAFQNERLRYIAGLFYTMMDEGAPARVDRALDQIAAPEVRTLLTQISLSPLQFDNADKAAADCIRKIKRRNLEIKIRELKKERNEAEKTGQTERSRQLHQLVRDMQTSLDRDEAGAAVY
ncbi:MAG: DNA primase [Nitrospinales bacterium]